MAGQRSDFELELTRLSSAGEAFGEDQTGRAVAVRGALPGDRVQVFATSKTRFGARAQGFALTHPSPHRRAPACDVHARCGGCGLMALAPEAQRAAKCELVVRELGELASRVSAPQFFASARLYGYRNRIRLRVEGGGAIGFFNAQKSAACSVLEPEVRERAAALAALSRREPGKFAAFRQLELRSRDLRGRAGLLFTARAGCEREAVAQIALLRLENPDSWVGLETEPALPSQERAIVEALYARVPLDAFLQVNDAVNARLVNEVRRGARARGVRSVLDLFSGAGNFSLPLAAAGCEVTAVETHVGALSALAAAAGAQGFTCETRAATSALALADYVARKRRFDLVVADPPRAGMGSAAALLAALGPPHLALCSCCPETLAQDARVLSRAGYALSELALFDMFPHTHHVESLAWFERGVRG